MHAWTRRNPALAVVGTALMLALAGGVILQTLANRRLQLALAESLLAQARLERSSGRAGQRFQTLALVARAVECQRAAWGGASRSSRVALRTETAAALALPDLRPLAHWPAHISHFENEFDFTANLDRYVMAAPDGGFTVFSTADHKPLWHFTGATNNPAIELRLSPDGLWAAASFQDGHVELHALVTSRPPRRWPGEMNAGALFAFAPSRGLFAVAPLTSTSTRSVEVIDLETGATQARVPGGHVMAMAFDQAATHLAMAGTDLVVVRLADTNKLWSAPLTHYASAVTWSADGRRLAVALDRRFGGASEPFKDNPVLLFDAASGRQQSVLAEVGTRVERLAFHPDGDSLLAATWQSELLWISARSAGFRLAAAGAQRALRFAPDGQRLAYAPSKEELGLLEVASPMAMREWQPASPPAQESFTLAVSTDARWVATGTGNGVQLWDADRRAEVASLPLPAKAWWVQVLFGPRDEFLYYSASSFGVRRVELVRTNGPDGRVRLQFGREQLLGEPTGFIVTSFAADGRSLLVGQNRRRSQNERVPPTIWLWPDGDPAHARKVIENFPLVGFRAVPGGRWAVSTDLIEPDLWVWNFETGERVRPLGIPLPTGSESTPDGRWLVTKTRTEFAVWEVGTWRQIGRWPANSTDQGTGWLVVSPDSRLLVTCAPDGRLTLRALPWGEELMALLLPRAMRLADWRFSPNGRRLFVMPADGQVFEWNLAEVRRELARLGLDWDDAR